MLRRRNFGKQFYKRLARTSQPAPNADSPGLSSSASSTSSEIEAKVSVASPSSPPLIQYTPPPMGVTRPGERAQSLPRLGIMSESSMVLRSGRHTSPIQSRHVRSRSYPQATDISHHSRPSDHQLPHESSQANTLLQVSPNPFGSPISHSQVPNPRPSTTISAPGNSTELPIRHLLKPTAPSRHTRRQSNPSPLSSFIDNSHQTEARPARQPTTNNAIPLESLNYCSPPSKAIFDFSSPAPQSQVTNPSTQTVITNGLRLSLPALTFDSQAVQRPGLNEQPKSVTEPIITRLSTFTAVTSVPAPHGSTPEASRKVVPTMATGSRPSVSSSPVSYSLEEFKSFGNWDKCLNPMESRGDRLGLTEMPLRQRSKDDTFLEQIANSVAAAVPPHFQGSTERNDPAPGPIAETERVGQLFCPSTIDVSIRDAIMNRVNKEGHIYILKSPQYFQRLFPNQPPLLKIGMVKDVSKRMESLREKCGLFDLARVADCQDRPVNFYWKVEELVHAELQNFRRAFKCKKCRNVKGTETEHREWFAVDEEVALRTVQRWRRFIELEPYDDNGILKARWSKMIQPKNMEHPDKREQWDDSQSRDRRWTRWLDEVVQGDEDS